MTTDQPTTPPPTAHEALAELARRLEAVGDRRLEAVGDGAWLPPASVARLVREFADTIPTPAADPEPDVRVTVNGLARDDATTIRLGGIDVAKWVTRADLRLDANSWTAPTLVLALDVPGVVAAVRHADVEVDIDEALVALLKAAGWTEPDRGPF